MSRVVNRHVWKLKLFCVECWQAAVEWDWHRCQWTGDVDSVCAALTRWATFLVHWLPLPPAFASTRYWGFFQPADSKRTGTVKVSVTYTYYKCTKHQFIHLLTATCNEWHIENSKKIIKKWYHSPSHRLTVNVLLNNITVLWFLLFSMCHSLHVAVNKCISYVLYIYICCFITIRKFYVSGQL